MKANERRQALLEHLCEVRQSTLENLAFHFSVSLSTIRRDVLELSLSYTTGMQEYTTNTDIPLPQLTRKKERLRVSPKRRDIT